MASRAEQKAQSRTSIVRAATRLLREKGISGMSVERAMAGAKLTVGAFYAHFADKDELLEEAFTVAMNDIGEVIQQESKGRTGRAPLLEGVGYYLSEHHRDAASEGCPLPALASSTVTMPEPLTVAQRVSRGVEIMADRMFNLAGGDLSRERALAVSVIMIGGQMLARATRGTPLSSRVLTACKDACHALIAPRRA